MGIITYNIQLTKDTYEMELQLLYERVHQKIVPRETSANVRVLTQVNERKTGRT